MTEVMDIAPLIYWAAGILAIANLANLVWSIFSGPTKKLSSRVGDLEARMAETEKRAERHAQQLVGISQTVNGMPGYSQMHQLELALADIRGNLREIGATMEGNAKIMARLELVVTRHEDHLLDGGKR